MGAASSLAPSYDLAFKKTRAAPSSLPPSARPPRTARERANGPAFPPMQRVRTSSCRASSTPIARKRAPRMTPLQTSSDLLGRRLGGGVLCAPVGAARFTERRRPRRRLTTTHSRKTEWSHRLAPSVIVRTPTWENERTARPSAEEKNPYVQPSSFETTERSKEGAKNDACPLQTSNDFPVAE